MNPLYIKVSKISNFDNSTEIIINYSLVLELNEMTFLNQKLDNFKIITYNKYDPTCDFIADGFIYLNIKTLLKELKIYKKNNDEKLIKVFEELNLYYNLKTI